MSPREHDPAVRDLIGAGDTLHEQLARFDRSDPPEELDRIVIERARQAIRMPQSERPIRQFRWAVPLAVAATLVISFALVLHQVSPPPPATPPTAANTEPAPQSTAPVAAQARVDEAAESYAYGAAEVRASPPPAAVAQAAPPPSTTSAAAESSTASRVADTVESTAPARAVPDVALAKAERLDRRTLTTRSATEESATASAADARAISGAAAAAPQAEAGEESAANAAKIDVRASPDTWIAYIARLRHAGRSDEADREYADFRRAFPYYKYSAPAPADAIAPNR
jgi:hypothetical protein